ncbi:hypothetical protein ACHAXR_003555 [Thalassiosira sp. AJA248-18]
MKVTKAMRLLQPNFGWTTAKSKQFSRTKLSGEFYNSILSHPRYNSSAWGDLEKNPDPSRRLVAFMDIDTCVELNYPTYGKDFGQNMDIHLYGETWYSILEQSCLLIKRAASSPALSANKDSRLILIDCGRGQHRLMDVCSENSTNRNNWGNLLEKNNWGNLLENDQVIIAYYGVRKQDARPIDIGLPPPAVKPITLKAHERQWIEQCKSRHYFFSFQGRGGFTREKLTSLNNGKDVYVKINPSSGGHQSNPYEDIMRDSVFAGAPRGDCLWSYRFTESFSAGSIPVVFANDWLPPFSGSLEPNRVVDWSQCAVFIGEGAKKMTLKKLYAIPEDKRCEMQKCALAFWDEFASSRDGWLKGILSWVNNEKS